MVLYHSAFDSDGSVVSVSDLKDRGLTESSIYTCIVCNSRLIPKIHGQVREAHFAHHPGTTCCPETYLHRLAKQVFYEVYRDCIESSRPFEIVLTHPTICKNYCDLLGKVCDLEQPRKIASNLVPYFDGIKMETSLDGFVPDLLIFNQRNPKKRIFIEIAVTHPCEEAKLKSSNRIIEIPISIESDIEVIRNRCLTANDARFENFPTPSRPVTDAHCKCHNQLSHAFVLYESGRSFMLSGTLREIQSNIFKRQSKLQFVRLYDMPRASEYGFRPTDALIFRAGIEEARACGIPIQNCFVCRHRQPNDLTSSRHKIQCKLLGKTFDSSNQAVDCSEFEYDPGAFDRAKKASWRGPKWRRDF